MTQKARQLTAEVISIGDEMTSGARLDTNAQWLSRRLGELGVKVTFHSTVGDTLSQNVDIFRIAANRADILVSTGGLGPTRDDLTRESLSQLVDKPLQIDESAMEYIKQMFIRRKREMPERNSVQAMFPLGSQQIFNPQGTAPGIDMMIPRDEITPSRVFALPGVPAEMKRMFDETVAPRILETKGSGTEIKQHVMKFFGTGESDMENRLGPMIARDREPRVGITVSTATISLRITATGTDADDCQNQIDQTRAEIMARVPEFYFGDGDRYEQHDAINEELIARRQNLMVVEYGRAAPLGDWFAKLGNSPAYKGGLSLANAQQLKDMFGGEREHEALMLLKQKCNLDWILVIDSYPPLEHDAHLPQPASDIRLTVISPAGESLANTETLGGHPEVLQPRIAKAGMAWLRKLLADTT
ncbi:molybdopterin-binding protein [bacterium]|nr:molybdopterin-binding protein [bacterium]MDA7906963.1 molybdopterin-binding protein [bacterium]